MVRTAPERNARGKLSLLSFMGVLPRFVYPVMVMLKVKGPSGVVFHTVRVKVTSRLSSFSMVLPSASHLSMPMVQVLVMLSGAVFSPARL